MPSYGVAISSQKTELSDVAAKEISEKIIKNEKPLIEMHDNTHDFKPYKQDFRTDVEISLTNDCNMLCKYCYCSSGGYKNQYLSKSNIETIIQQLYKNAELSKLSGQNETIVKVVVSGGGEPTLAWNQIKHLVNTLNKFKHSTNIDYNLHITTNGVFSDQKAHYLSENFHDIQISFDCAEDIQNVQRPMFDGSPSYDYVKRTLDYFDENEIAYRVNTVVSPEYYARLFDMVKGLLTAHKNIKEVHVAMCSFGGRATSILDIKKNAGTFINNYLKVKKYFANHKVQITCSSISLKPRPHYCEHILRTGSYIDANGYIVPCPQKIDIETYGIGNINYPKLYTVNEKAFYNEWYKPMLACCNDCLAYYYCGGGCPVDMKRHPDGSYVKNESYILCSLKRNLFAGIIQQIVDGNPPRWVVAQPLRHYSSSSIKVVSYREI